MQLTQVIYADVLFILNCYITYILMLVTGIISGAQAKRLRIALAALLGGLYSLIIFIPDISDTLVTVSRVPAALIFILTAYGKVRSRVFVRLFSSFFLVNFIFAGLMLALWCFLHPQNMYLGGFVVYFDISPLMLISLTAVCYFIIRTINKIIEIRQPKNTIFDMTVHIDNKDISLKAFYDTGNNLTDPFTGKKVIIVCRSALKEIVPEDKDLYSLVINEGLNVRFLPADTLGGTSLLPCIKAQRVHIKGVALKATLPEAMIALTDKKIKGGAFDALLPTGIFDNITSEKGEDYDEAIKTLTAYFKK